MNILSYDLGTSALKAVLFTAQGDVLGAASEAYQTAHPAGGWAEQNAEDWWNAAVRATQQLTKTLPVEMRAVEAIGVSGHMLGCLPVDKAGCALRPAFIHSDARAMAEEERIAKAFGREHIYEWTGGVLDAKSPLAKQLWLLRNEPDVYRAAARFLQSKDYLVARLTGNIDTTDYSDASHAQLINVHTKRYLVEEMTELGLDTDKQPELHKSSDVIGHVTAEAAGVLGIRAGIAVVAGGGDGSCATAGAGIVRSGDAYCSLGTTAWITCNSPVPVVDPAARVFNIMNLDGESFGVFGTTEAAGKSVDWVRTHFGLESAAQVSAGAQEAPAGCDGLVFLPYLEGERSPIFDPNAKGVFFGIRAGHTPAYFMRSVLEGVACALRSILSVHRESMPIPSMKIIGGGTKSDVWMHTIADICQVELQLFAGAGEGVTSLGAALAAAVGAGVYRDFAEASRNLPIGRVIVPEQTHADVYDRNFETYSALYPRLKDLF